MRCDNRTLSPTTPQELRDFLRKPNKRSTSVSAEYEMDVLPRRSKRIRSQRTPDATPLQSSSNPPEPPGDSLRRSKRAKLESSKNESKVPPPQSSPSDRKEPTLPGWIFSPRFRKVPPPHSSTNLPGPGGTQEICSMPTVLDPELSQPRSEMPPPQSSTSLPAPGGTQEICSLPTVLDPELSQHKSNVPPLQSASNPPEPCSSARRPIKPLRRHARPETKSNIRTYQLEPVYPHIKYMKPLQADSTTRKQCRRRVRDDKAWIFDEHPVVDFRNESVFLDEDDDEHPLETWASWQLRKAHRMGRDEWANRESAAPEMVKDDEREGDEGNGEEKEDSLPKGEGIESGQAQWPESRSTVQPSEEGERTLSQTKWEDIQYGQAKWPETGRSKRW